jgi:hypothetical protein
MPSGFPMVASIVQISPHVVIAKLARGSCPAPLVISVTSEVVASRASARVKKTLFEHSSAAICNAPSADVVGGWSDCWNGGA